MTALRDAGGVVNTSIAIAAANGIVRRHDSNLLAVNGGHILLTKHWAQYLMERMGYVKRKATTKAKITVENLAALKEQFLLDIRGLVEMEEIPPDLILNWDQTAVNYVPVSNWTMAKEGSKSVPVAGIDDKCQITLVLAAAMTGKLLPLQLVHQGKTKACLPTVSLSKSSHFICAGSVKTNFIVHKRQFKLFSQTQRLIKTLWCSIKISAFSKLSSQLFMSQALPITRSISPIHLPPTLS